MEGKKQARFELSTGNLVLTRNTQNAAIGSAVVYFGIGADRNPQDVLDLVDTSVEWVFEVIEERGNNLRIRLEVPEGMKVLRRETLDRDNWRCAEQIEKTCAKRTPLVCFAQKNLIQRVLLYKSSLQKMVQRRDLLKMYADTGFLPVVRMNFWQEELRGQKRLVVTVMAITGTAMFGKTPLLETPFVD